MANAKRSLSDESAAMKTKEARILDVERAHKLAQMELDNVQTKYKNA